MVELIRPAIPVAVIPCVWMEPGTARRKIVVGLPGMLSCWRRCGVRATQNMTRCGYGRARGLTRSSLILFA